MSSGKADDRAGPSGPHEETPEELAYYDSICAPPDAREGSSPRVRDDHDDGNEADDEENDDAHEMEEAQRTEEPPEESEYEGHHSGDETTTSGAGGNTTDGGAASDASKRARKERDKNKVGTVKETFTRVDASGAPKSPVKLAKGYGNQCAALVRENVSINTENIRRKENIPLATVLVQKLHARYKFPAPHTDSTDLKDVVNSFALGKFSKGLSTWRSSVRKMLDKGPDGLAELKKSYPQIPDADLDIFRAKHSLTSDQAHRDWGRELASKNLGPHNLGSRGYDGKQPKWDKEDAAKRAAGQIPIWDKYNDDPLAKSFIRSRYREDPVTKEHITTEKVQKLEENLVSNLPA